MKKKILIALGVIIFVWWGIAFSKNLSSPKNINSSTPPSLPESPLATKSTLKTDKGEGGVTVAASYQEKQDTLVFSISLDTHSVDLSSFNPMTQLYLEDKGGTKIIPKTIVPEGDSHHRSFNVVFPKPSSSITLVVENLASIPRRTLRWE